MHYQGPVVNPATEVNIACGGRILSDTSRSPQDVLSEVVEALYKPKTVAAQASLADIYKRGERIYFEQWSDERFQKAFGTDPPGEFYLGKLFDDSPGAAGYMIYDYFLDAKGRRAYKQGLISILRDVETIRHSFHDNGARGAATKIHHPLAYTFEHRHCKQRRVRLRSASDEAAMVRQLRSPKVMLLTDTCSAYGRGLLDGIGPLGVKIDRRESGREDGGRSLSRDEG